MTTLQHPFRLGVGLLLVGACAGFIACSSAGTEDLNDRLKNGAEPTTDGTEVDTHDGSDTEGDLDSAAPSDDPSVDVDTDPDDGEGSVTTEDAGAKPSGGNCVKGGFYCGGDKVTGDAKTLYKCEGPGEPTVIEKCANGCMVNPGQDDSCAPAAGARVASPVPGKKVTYAYGVKNPRYAAGYHTGDDYATATGSNAVAVRAGKIVWSNDNGGAYGKWMGLEADNGRTYVYCHLSKRLLTAGTTVTAGQLIAKTGATGNVTGPHLHFEDHPKGPFKYAQTRKPAW